MRRLRHLRFVGAQFVADQIDNPHAHYVGQHGGLQCGVFEAMWPGGCDAAASLECQSAAAVQPVSAGLHTRKRPAGLEMMRRVPLPFVKSSDDDWKAPDSSRG